MPQRRPQPTPNLPVSPTRPQLGRREHLLLLLVFVAALAFRGAYLWSQARNNPLFEYPQMDGHVHDQWARRIASGEGMPPEPYLRAPLYYYLLGLLYAVGGPSVAAARMAGSVLGALTCYVIARLGATLAGFRTGLLAGLIAAVYWPLVFFDAELVGAGLETLLNTLLIWTLIVAGRRGRWRWFLLAGVVWGLSAITRPNVLVLAPAVWLWALLTGIPRRTWRQRIIAPLAVTAGLALPILPVTLRNHFVGHEAILVASSGGVNFYIGNNPKSNGYLALVPEARPTWNEWLIDIRQIPERELGRKLTDGQVSDYWYDRAGTWIREQPGAWLSLLLLKLRLFWSPIEVPNDQPIWMLARQSAAAALFWVGFPVVAVLAAGGLVSVWRASRDWLVPLGLLVLYMLTVVAFFCPARYRLPVVPVLIVLAAAGLGRLPGLLFARQWRRVVVYLAACAAFAVFLLTNPPSRADFHKQDEAEYHTLLGRHYATPAPEGAEDLHRAAEEFRVAVELDPTSPHRRAALANVLLRLQDNAGAGEQLARAVAAAPQSAAARKDYASFLASVGDGSQAIEQYSAALQLNPRDAEAHQALGGLLVRAGRPADAVTHLREAVRLAPGLTEARYNLGVTLLQLGQPETGRDILAALVADQPAYALAWQSLGVAHARLSTLDKAAEAFRQALQLDPSLSESAVNLARTLRLGGQSAAALAVLNKQAEISRANVQVLTALADLLATAPEANVRNGERAVRLAEQARELSAQMSIPTMDALAAAYAEVGRLEDAVRTCQEAINSAREARSDYWVNKLNARLQYYAQNQPYHQQPSGP